MIKCIFSSPIQLAVTDLLSEILTVSSGVGVGILVNNLADILPVLLWAS